MRCDIDYWQRTCLEKAYTSYVYHLSFNELHPLLRSLRGTVSASLDDKNDILAKRDALCGKINCDVLFLETLSTC